VRGVILRCLQWLRKSVAFQEIPGFITLLDISDTLVGARFSQHDSRVNQKFTERMFPETWRTFTGLRTLHPFHYFITWWYEKCIQNLFENRNHFRKLIDRRTILIRASKKLDTWAWNVFHWLRIGTSSGLLSTQQWISALHKRKVICWPPIVITSSNATISFFAKR
jgi:hypothetical protein